MESVIRTISGLFQSGGNVHYVLPHFQREYIWDQEQWKELLRDLFFVRQEYQSEKPIIHFMGLMVVVPDGMISGTITKFKVVDGQQRLITISLIICVLRELSKKKKKNTTEAQKLDLLLINPYEEGNARYKVLPSTRRGDWAAYSAIIDNQPLSGKSSRISDAYRYLHREISRRISKKEFSAEELHEVLVNCLQVALVILNRNDEIESPYKIFESLDGKGKLLSQADLVRNYIAMSLPLDFQKRVFEEDWVKIEDLLLERNRLGKTGELTAFLRHYLAMRRHILYPEDRVYARFRDYIEQNHMHPQAFMQEITTLRRFAEHYNKLLTPAQEAHLDIRKALTRLNTIEVSAAYPMLLAAYDTYRGGGITAKDFVSLLSMLENLLVRRYLCSESPSVLAKWFPTLWNEIKQAQEKHSFTEACRKSLLAAKFYPTDRQLRQSVQITKLYSGRMAQSRTKITFILTTIEEQLWDKADVYLQLKGPSTIEHIMPQTLTGAWKKELGDTWEQTHTDHLHTLGNLTLVTQGKNSQLSNSSFMEKRQLLLHQGLRVNAYFTQSIPYWNESAILTRADWLTQRILEIWPASNESSSSV